MFQAFLGLLAVLAAAAVTVHWQRLKHEAEVLRDDFRSVVTAGADFHVAVDQCKGYLYAEDRQEGRLWDYQRKEFQTAAEAASKALVTLGAAITLFNASAPSKVEVASRFFEAAGRCSRLLDRIQGWVPHPDAPPEQNARVTLITRDVNVQLDGPGLAAALWESLKAYSAAVDDLSKSVAQTLNSLLIGVNRVAYVTYALLAIALVSAGFVVLYPRPVWAATVQSDRIVWVNAAARSYSVTQLPSRTVSPDTTTGDHDGGICDSPVP